MAKKLPAEPEQTVELVDATPKPKKLRYMQKFKEDLEKNPPDAPDPALIEQYIKSAGRPPRYRNKEEMQEIITDYFLSCMTEIYDAETGEAVGYRWCKRPTLGDISLHLGMTISQLWDYGNRDEFSQTIKMAKNIVENYYEKALQENRNPAGIIFIMKNGFGWKDMQQIEVTPNAPLGDQLDPDQIIREAQALPEYNDSTDD